MPTYDYRCKFCQEHTEAFQKMSDASLTQCPHCGMEGLERVVTGGAGVIYKGAGWYVTDYSKKSSGGKEEQPASKDKEKQDSKTATEPNNEKGSTAVKPKEAETSAKPDVKESKLTDGGKKNQGN